MNTERSSERSTIDMDMQAHYVPPRMCVQREECIGRECRGWGCTEGDGESGWMGSEEVAQSLYMKQMLVKKDWQNLLF